MMTARAREVSIGDNDDEKDSLTHFLSFALHRFMVSLCSGNKGDDKGDDDGKRGRSRKCGNYDKNPARERVALLVARVMTRGS